MHIFNLTLSIRNKLFVLISVQIIDIIIWFCEFYYNLKILEIIHQIYNFICLSHMIYKFNKLLHKSTWFLRSFEIYKIKIIRMKILSIIYICTILLSYYNQQFNYVSIIILLFFIKNYHKEIKLIYKFANNKTNIYLFVFYFLLLLLHPSMLFSHNNK